jgi:glucuronoarabinoxylan endo-1,4-beta-xylanase
MRRFYFSLIVTLVLGSGPIARAASGSCTVDWNTVFQRIDGFGASSAWDGSWTPAQADMFFSTNASGTGTSFDGKTNFSYTGAGLSLLRNHIVYASSTASSASPSTGETYIMQLAQQRGARVWSTPWTPASGFKSNGSPNGGNYLGSGNNATNLAYASQLANYIASMKNTYGVNIYALSIQNEPDANVTSYEAAVWTGTQFHDFVTNLYNAMVAKGVSSTKIILPESQNWASNPGLYNPTLNDPVAAADVSIIANHDYVGDNVVGDVTTPAALPVSGKALWETEVSQIDGGYDGSITNAIYWAGRIHLFMTAAQANAWHYWWLVSGNADNEGLTDTNGIPAKRLYALGQFARFVRPNYYRINVANNTGSVEISAYKDSASANFAIVAINSNSAPVTQVFTFTNVIGISSVTPWLTTSNLSLGNQAPVAVVNSNFTYVLPALSIATFTGLAGTNTPPVFAAVGNQTINPGFALALTNSATTRPFQTLTYTMLTGPTNSTLNVTNGVFNWRPLLSQANTTNLVSARATDDGMPNLSATNSFNIIVAAVTEPVLSAHLTAGGNVSLVMNGAQGPDYSLLDSSNLTSWQVLFTTNAPTLPVTFVDTNAVNLPATFYRVQVGP